MAEEYVPLEHFNRLYRRWWLIVLATILGGGLGYLYYAAQTPIYQATATFYVTIDLEKFPFEETPIDLFQYNEDLAIAAVEGVMRSQEVLQGVLDEAARQGLPLSTPELIYNIGIERKHAFWEARFRHSDPALAQAVVNLWAQMGYKAMLAWQEEGRVANFVIFNPPSLAPLPQEPVTPPRSQLMTAGSVLGFLVGVLAANWLARSRRLESPSERRA